MKLYYLALFAFILSCQKTTETENKNPQNTDDQCFILNQGINFDEKKVSPPLPTKDEIRRKIPSHVSMATIADYKEFSYDQKKIDSLKLKEKEFFTSKKYQDQFAEQIAALPEFQYLSVQENYTLAKNKYGLWIVEKMKEEYKPYFLGLTQNIYLPDLYSKNQTFLKDSLFVMKGSIVGIQRLSRVPMLPKYEVVDDGIEFSIALDDLKKDSDKDGFNDIFENFIGLSPLLADADDDGISDFDDANPKFKTGKDRFTAMYEALIDHGSSKTKYSFTEILTDCSYFQAINPKNVKVLIYNTTNEAPLKDDVLDLFFPSKYSKMRMYKNYDNVYFTDFSDETGDGTLSAEFLNGKWKFDKKYTVTFGM
jgi:hypothetical protein